MGRIARYDPVANIVETLTGVDVFAFEYDTATKIAYVLIDKSNNIIAGRIDRTTATIISETPVSRLSATPRIFKPVVI
ncbi:MAG TPA: hypothetical protein VNP94_05795 [Actinomycetota bacterium]|nr:hypothetical protein [Actinomycetota bacterium]